MSQLRVNGELIEKADVEREVAAVLALMAQRMQEEDPELLRKLAREWAEENLIEAALLRQASKQAGETVEQLMERITAPASAPKHKDILAFYVKNKDSFQQAEKIRVAHIVKNVDEQHCEEDARAGIELALVELAKGRAFGEVADELSDCPGRGGELDLFRRGEMVESFEEVVFGMRVGEVSGIFRSEFGFHIAKVLEHRPAGVSRMDEVSGQISEQLLREKKQKRLNQYVDSLRARAVVAREETAAG